MSLHTEVYDWALGNPTASEYAEILRDNRVTYKSFHRPDIIEDLTSIRKADGTQAIPMIVAKDIVADFLSDSHFGEVAIFWDVENVRPPRGVALSDAATAIIKGLQTKYGNVTDFKMYMDISKSFLTDSERVDLQDAKVEVVDAFHNGRKEVADKMIIVDALWHAMEYRRIHHGATPIICIVSGDSDFSPLFSKLSMNGFHCVCIHHNALVRSLHKKAGQAFTWRHFGLVAAAAGKGGPQASILHEMAGSVPVSGAGSDGGAAATAAVPSAPVLPPTGPLGGSAAYFAGPPPPYYTTKTPAPTDAAYTKIEANNNGKEEEGGDKTCSAPTASSFLPPPSPPMTMMGEPQPSEALCDQEVDDLLNAIRESLPLIASDAAPGQVLRSQAGLLFRKKTICGDFKNAVQRALNLGLVEVGGSLGRAWIRIVADQRTTRIYLIAAMNGTLRYDKAMEEDLSLAANMPLLRAHSLSCHGVTITRAAFGPFSSEQQALKVFEDYGGLLEVAGAWVSTDSDDLTRVNVGGALMECNLFVVNQGLLTAFLQGETTALPCPHRLCKFGDRCIYVHSAAQNDL